MNQTQDDQPDEELEAPPARWGSLWLLTFGPGIWAVHFLLCYVTAAVWCARVAGMIVTQCLHNLRLQCSQS